MEQPLKQVSASLVAHTQPPAAEQPGLRPLDDPSVLP